MTMRIPLTALAIAGLLSADAHAQGNTDIYLAPLRMVRDSLIVGPAVNATRRAGYDNQPSFSPDSRSILYTASDSAGRADIWRLDIASDEVARVTNTPESEYSPTVMPDGKRFSVIRVERDSAQRLWSFALDGSDPQLVLRNLKPVGYHAWLDNTHLVTFVLGSPSTLHAINRDGTGDEILARDIGRSLHRIPQRPAFSYTQRDSATKKLWIISRPVGSRLTSRLLPAPEDNEFHTWTPDGQLLTATGGVLVRWNFVREPVGAWIPVANLASNGVKNVSRLAVSPNGRWLAFVAEPVAP